MSSELEQRSYWNSVIGLGGAALYKHSYELGVATVKHALDLGVTYFDTSPASEKVSVIGLGGAALYKHSYELGVATVKHALDLGVTYFDTSPASGEVQGRRRFSSQFETTVQWKWRWGIHIWSLLVESRTRKNFLTIGFLHFVGALIWLK